MLLTLASVNQETCECLFWVSRCPFVRSDRADAESIVAIYQPFHRQRITYKGWAAAWSERLTQLERPTR